MLDEKLPVNCMYEGFLNISLKQFKIWNEKEKKLL